MRMLVSVVIPARNEEQRIAACLASLAAQSLPRVQFEVIVVDNGSTDRTAEIAASFGSRLNLIVLHKVGGTIAAVRNFGAKAAQGEILAFLDADCQTRCDWLARGLQIAPHGKGIWGAHYLLTEDATWVSRVWNAYQAREIAGETTFIPSSNLFVRNDDFWELGGFNPEVKTSEDVELCARARQAGLSVTAFPELAIRHSHSPRTLTEFYRKNRWHGISVLPNFIRNLPSRRHLPLIAISFYALVTFWAMIAAMMMALAGLISPAWTFLLLAVHVAPALLIALAKTKARLPKSTLLLSVLYEAYFLSRASALLHCGEQLRPAAEQFAKAHPLRTLWTHRRI